MVRCCLERLRALTADAREVACTKLEQASSKRNAQEKSGREYMRDAIKDDSCAKCCCTCFFVGNSLQHRTAPQPQMEKSMHEPVPKA